MEEKKYTKCIVTDLTPGYILKKIVLLIRPTYTVQRVIDDLKCLLTYSEFDVILQPADETMDMVRLNDNITKLIYDVPGFSQKEENALFLLQLGQWSGDIKKRFDLHSLENPLFKTEFARSLFRNSSDPEKGTTTTTGSNTDASGGDGDDEFDNIRNNLIVKCQPFKRWISAEMSDEMQQNEEQIEAGPSNNNVGCSNGSGDGIGNNVASPSPLKEITKDENVSNVGEEFGIRTNNEKSNHSQEVPPPIKIRVRGITEDEKYDVNYKNVLKGRNSLSKIAAYLEEQASLYHNKRNGDGLTVYSSDVKQREDSPPPEMSAAFINESLVNAYRCGTGNPTYMPDTTSDLVQVASRDDKNSDGYVGLVNHAMTCYLNSFLQSLYMTPEFRNNLYRCDCSLSDTYKKSLPYQIKKLFYRLQSSKRKAIDTLGIIHSIAWIETCQQHDVQELCRIVFDDLEQKFQNTSANNLIKNLYEGTMIDYVKCLECGTEKTREDSFLDIQLPIRPFGSNVSFKDIKESLNAFVTPEILDGNNQYHCEKCNKKCNAHKGLKITRIPYILMLQLKRFNFDFSTLERTKINDTVLIPAYLNLEAILNATEYKAESYGDISEVEINAADGNKYIYELFTIMVHAGTSVSGHYYAYIKDMGTKRWYKFDDQRVEYVANIHEMDNAAGVLNDDGKSGIGAYMLMYRRVDPEVNETPLKVSEFPENMKEIVDIVNKEEGL